VGVLVRRVFFIDSFSDEGDLSADLEIGIEAVVYFLLMSCALAGASCLDRSEYGR
jgi:hypothetical protein